MTQLDCWASRDAHGPRETIFFWDRPPEKNAKGSYTSTHEGYLFMLSIRVAEKLGLVLEDGENRHVRIAIEELHRAH